MLVLPVCNYPGYTTCSGLHANISSRSLEQRLLSCTGGLCVRAMLLEAWGIRVPPWLSHRLLDRTDNLWDISFDYSLAQLVPLSYTMAVLFCKVPRIISPIRCNGYAQ